jgi:hypothetical protein
MKYFPESVSVLPLHNSGKNKVPFKFLFGSMHCT